MPGDGSGDTAISLKWIASYFPYLAGLAFSKIREGIMKKQKFYICFIAACVILLNSVQLKGFEANELSTEQKTVYKTITGKKQLFRFS